MVDKDKLTKLLAMTTSDNDGEALNAMRMANKIVKGAGLTWEQVLTEPPRRVTVTVSRNGFNPGPTAAPPEDWSPPHLKDKVIIDLMFRAVYSQPRSSNEEFWQFMDSIHERWRKFGNLTQDQYNALKNCYNRVRKT